MLMAGIGGQGVLTASEILAEAAMAAGSDVKKTEVHGMAQRGGVVTSQVRIGPRVFSPVIDGGEVDVLVAFEEAEALRAAPDLRPGGTLIVNCLRVAPPVVSLGLYRYPDGIRDRLAGLPVRLLEIEASAVAVRAGSPRLAGTVLLGALSTVLDLPQDLWEGAMAARFPRQDLLAANLQAFAAGRAAALDPDGRQ